MVLKGQTWLVYLDDKIVIELSFEDHMKNMEEVFSRPRTPVLKLSQTNAVFLTEKSNIFIRFASEGVAEDKQKLN